MLKLKLGAEKQAGKDRAQRLRSRHGTMALCSRALAELKVKDLRNWEVLVVDDVIATGATIGEACRVITENQGRVRAVLTICASGKPENSMSQRTLG